MAYTSAQEAKIEEIYANKDYISVTWDKVGKLNVNEEIKGEYIDDLVDEIKRIDNDDQLYMSILKEPALLPSALSIDEEYDRLEKWLIPIFERPICESYRRNREMHGLWYIWRRHYLSILDDRNPKKNWELLHLFINKFITILRFPKRS